MVWLIISICVLVFGLLIYVFYPSIKQLFSSTKKDKTFKIKKDKKIKEPKNKNENNKVEIIQNDGDLFSEKAEIVEDLDTKVDIDNFDLGGLFEEEYNVNSNQESSDGNLYDKNFDDLFKSYLSDDHSLNKKAERPFGLSPKDRLMRNEELSDLLGANSKFNDEKNDVASQFHNLPDEVKALILSNFLDRKDI